jgi:hypothetical protein
MPPASVSIFPGLLIHSFSQCRAGSRERARLHHAIIHSGSKAKSQSARAAGVIGGRARDHGEEPGRWSVDHAGPPVELHRCQRALFVCGLLHGNSCRRSGRARSKNAPPRESCGGFCRRAGKFPAPDRPPVKHRRGRVGGADLARSTDDFAPTPQRRGGHHREERGRRGLHRLTPRPHVRATAELCLYGPPASRRANNRGQSGKGSRPNSKNRLPSRSPRRRKSSYQIRP